MTRRIQRTMADVRALIVRDTRRVGVLTTSSLAALDQCLSWHGEPDNTDVVEWKNTLVPAVSLQCYIRTLKHEYGIRFGRNADGDVEAISYEVVTHGYNEDALLTGGGLKP